MIIFTRINHSCAPNSAWSWIASDPRKRKKVVRAVREVASLPDWLVKNEKVILMIMIIFRWKLVKKSLSRIFHLQLCSQEGSARLHHQHHKDNDPCHLHHHHHRHQIMINDETEFNVQASLSNWFPKCACTICARPEDGDEVWRL